MLDILGLGLGPLIVIIIRIVVPLLIFRFPFYGALAAALADLLDVVLTSIIGLGDFNNENYSRIDKLLDMYFITILVFSSLAWEGLAKWTSITLYVYRALGVLLFEITGLRVLLFIFPNLFLPFYLFYAARNRYFSQFELTSKKLAIILFIILVPKLIQEYLLHIVQVHPWEWLNSNIFHFGK